MYVKPDAKEDLRSMISMMAYLIGCAVREEVPDSARLEGVDSDELLDFAANHMLVAVVASAIESAGLATGRVREGVVRGVWRAAQFEVEWKQVQAGLEDAGIWYCPLKGMVISKLYPYYGMREMADYDVLFDAERTEDVREIMERCGFSAGRSDHACNEAYLKQPILNFEMHHKLFSKADGPRLEAHFSDIKNRLVKDACNDFGYHMDVDECYLYLVAHEFKHYVVSGTGLRSLLDTYVYLRAYADILNWDYITATAYSMGMGDFEAANRLLARHLFSADCDELSDVEYQMLDYLAESGAFGTLRNKVFNGMEQGGGGVRGRVRYLRDRLFPPADVLEDFYPSVFFKYRILMPVLFAYRIRRAITVKRKLVVAELRSLTKMENEHRRYPKARQDKT